MNTDSGFSPVLEARLTDAGRPPHDADHPYVIRGAASHWRAVRTWSFERLAAAVPDVQVELVQGNREAGTTRLMRSALRTYLASLQHPAPAEAPPAYLKEFDLLKLVPRLRDDLDHRKLLPPRTLSSTRCWIGPAAAGTGLHHDYLDNVAVQILGIKRWNLVRAGTVERLGALSGKYDPWAVLASASAGQLAAQGGAGGDFLTVDLMPGDVLHVPARWWHEVSNLTPTLMFGGFHGPASTVLGRMAWVGARNLRHRVKRGDCTCHAAP